MPEDPLSRPFGELDFADELGSDPCGRLGGLRGCLERAVVDFERSEPGFQVAQGLVIEAGSDLAAVDEAPLPSTARMSAPSWFVRRPRPAV